MWLHHFNFRYSNSRFFISYNTNHLACLLPYFQPSFRINGVQPQIDHPIQKKHVYKKSIGHHLAITTFRAAIYRRIELFPSEELFVVRSIYFHKAVLHEEDFAYVPRGGPHYVIYNKKDPCSQRRMHAPPFGSHVMRPSSLDEVDHVSLHIHALFATRTLFFALYCHNEDPICSRVPDFLLEKPLTVLIPSSRCTLPLKVLFPSTRDPHLPEAVFLLQGV